MEMLDVPKRQMSRLCGSFASLSCMCKLALSVGTIRVGGVAETELEFEELVARVLSVLLLWLRR
jgi:hypothetical protein